MKKKHTVAGIIRAFRDGVSNTRSRHGGSKCWKIGRRVGEWAWQSTKDMDHNDFFGRAKLPIGKTIRRAVFRGLKLRTSTPISY